MTLDFSRSNIKANRLKRAEWLAQHPELWIKDKQALVKEMQYQGLISPSTYWKDVDTDTLIQLARRMAHGA